MKTFSLNGIAIGLVAVGLLLAVKAIASDPMYNIKIDLVLRFDIMDILVAFFIGYFFPKFS